MMTDVRGASNAKAKRDLGWQLLYPSWRGWASPKGSTETTSGVPIVEELRPRAFAVAYLMLGSVSEAEDIVQEALLRLHHTRQQGGRIESPRAYLSTVVTRLCIDQLRSARVRGELRRRMALVDDGRSDPADHAEVSRLVPGRR